jgi:RNA-splicing ligase RtcB
VVADETRRDASLEQVANGSTLPGIVKASLTMPDVLQDRFGISTRVAW